MSHRAARTVDTADFTGSTSTEAASPNEMPDRLDGPAGNGPHAPREVVGESGTDDERPVPVASPNGPDGCEDLDALHALVARTDELAWGDLLGSFKARGRG
jgi:hypothetical protein